MENLINQTCLRCKRELKGRTDKKFCNDDCRSTYHNDKNYELDTTMRKITRILRQNRRILRELLKQTIEAVVEKDDLLSNGFQKDYHTQVKVNRDGHRIYYCFEYGYHMIHDNSIKIFYQDKFKN
jgi:hypothetical protein